MTFLSVPAFELVASKYIFVLTLTSDNIVKLIFSIETHDAK